MKPHGNAVLAFPFCVVSLAMLSVQAQAEINDWDYEALYQDGGIRAESLLNAKAIGSAGDAIGTIKNAILDEENQVVTLIAEVGGMWDSGDRHVSIPWEEAELSQEGVRVPVHEDNIEDYNLFDDEYVDDAYIFKGGLQHTTQVESDVMTGPRIWKITDILDDFASLGKDTGVGYITDALLTREGVLQAIVVEPSGTEFGEGPYAYPIYGHPDVWQPGAMHYELPYSREELSSLPSFDYDKYDSLWD
ncbi:PRC-barrel domain-containing protein [Halomonas cerina]|uniref:Sporulation protein YlmC with PRC-barrel domain n=1 Tax=Halomonas cerina TaxID=447424 RepID=A0A839V5G8_9GAMM|nr:PRC-barrel domain-containing protein [Halomonas cerina]MBB3189238.1 sporulation protein YlmC with PRC-barrel domain [Halomonas cerina]